jgi:hypothetical protein
MSAIIPVQSLPKYQRPRQVTPLPRTSYPPPGRVPCTHQWNVCSVALQTSAPSPVVQPKYNRPRHLASSVLVQVRPQGLAGYLDNGSISDQITYSVARLTEVTRQRLSALLTPFRPLHISRPYKRRALHVWYFSCIILRDKKWNREWQQLVLWFDLLYIVQGGGGEDT